MSELSHIENGQCAVANDTEVAPKAAQRREVEGGQRAVVGDLEEAPNAAQRREVEGGQRALRFVTCVELSKLTTDSIL